MLENITSELALVAMIITGVIWGVTNMALEKYVDLDQKPKEKKKQSIVIQLVTNWKFLVLYGLNQIGSVLFQLFIGFTDLGIGNMLANGTCFVSTYLGESYLGVNKITKNGIIGFAFIGMGLYVLFSQPDEKSIA